MTVEAVVFQHPVPEQKRKIYLPLGRWKIRVPRRKPVRIGLAVVMLLSGLVPTPTSPFLISGAVTLLSMTCPGCGTGDESWPFAWATERGDPMAPVHRRTPPRLTLGRKPEACDADRRIQAVRGLGLSNRAYPGKPASRRLCGARVVEMNALLAQAKPFVFIFLDSAESPAHADQKAQAKWLKTNKKQLRRVCRGFVSIEPDPAKRLLKRAR